MCKNVYPLRKKAIPTKEIVNQVYDMLSGNGGMSKYHVTFNPEYVSCGEVDPGKGVIILRINDKNNIKITIENFDPQYFDDME